MSTIIAFYDTQQSPGRRAAAAARGGGARGQGGRGGGGGGAGGPGGAAPDRGGGRGAGGKRGGGRRARLPGPGRHVPGDAECGQGESGRGACPARRAAAPPVQRDRLCGGRGGSRAAAHACAHQVGRFLIGVGYQAGVYVREHFLWAKVIGASLSRPSHAAVIAQPSSRGLKVRLRRRSPRLKRRPPPLKTAPRRSRPPPPRPIRSRRSGSSCRWCPRTRTWFLPGLFAGTCLIEPPKTFRKGSRVGPSWWCCGGSIYLLQSWRRGLLWNRFSLPRHHALVPAHRPLLHPAPPTRLGEQAHPSAHGRRGGDVCRVCHAAGASVTADGVARTHAPGPRRRLQSTRLTPTRPRPRRWRPTQAPSRSSKPCRSSWMRTPIPL